MPRLPKIAGIPPQQAKTGLAVDPEIAKIAVIARDRDIGKEGLTTDEHGLR